MLTLILLVVLGGGAGLLAVWLIDARGLSGLFGRLEKRSLRRTRPPATARRAAPKVPDAPIEVPLAPLPAQVLKARRGGSRVPAAYTAVEGSYRDVARAPLWRKLVSLVALLVVLLLVGVAIAALAGATLGAVAELVDGAVG